MMFALAFVALAAATDFQFVMRITGLAFPLSLVLLVRSFVHSFILCCQALAR